MARKKQTNGPDTSRKVPGEDVIYREVLAAILDQRLPPGTKLREDEIGEIFGVSRTVIRGVIGRLAHERVLDAAPYRTARVAKPSPRDARDVFNARMVIEDEIVRVAAANASKAEIRALRQVFDEEAEARRTDNRRLEITLSGRFHLMLAEIAGNTVLQTFLKELISRTSLIIALYGMSGSRACASEEHAGLLDAVARHDAVAAAGAMRSHLQGCLDRLKLDGEPTDVDLEEVFGNFDAGKALAV